MGQSGRPREKGPPPSPCPRPIPQEVTQPHQVLGQFITDHTSGNEAPRDSKIETGFPGTATISENLGSGSLAQGQCHSVIQQTSLCALSLSPVLAWYNALLPAPAQEGNTQGC